LEVGDHAAAEEAFTNLRTHTRQHGHRLREGAACVAMGALAIDRGDLAGAGPWLDGGPAIPEERAAGGLLAVGLLYLRVPPHRRGEYADAQRHYARALTLTAARTVDAYGIRAGAHLAALHADADRLADAERALADARARMSAEASATSL